LYRGQFTLSMKKLCSFILITCSMYSCRSTNLVFISVLQPAPVTMRANIKNVGIVNRSIVNDKNKALDIVDKVLSMEGDSLDRQVAQEGIIGLADELIKNNRFSNVTAFNNIDLRTAVPGQFSAPLAWDQVDKICGEKKIDALFVLELFDTDSKVSYAAVPVSINTPLGKIPGIEHHASMLTTVKTGWRIYDPLQREILDEYALTRDITFSGKGINPVAAASAIMNRKEALKDVSSRAGHAYALRLIPYWIRVSRDYYVKGTENFKIGKRKAQTGNWEGAAELWKKETTSASSKIAGRACYNMAIICEINGELDTAISWAQKAYENYNNQLALGYIKVLKNRKAKENELK
jgi:tetratricopeptide (TPR) repeat protein